MLYLDNIRELVPFLEKCLGTKVLDYSVKYLAKPGENYGSTMLSIMVKVNERNGANNRLKTVELAIKTPVKNDVLINLFQPAESCIKENCFYTEIIPTLQDLQRECGIPEENIIDIFIKCYGARLSLNSETKVADEDALLVLENIKVSGFKCANPEFGFDRMFTMKILEKIAQFHALPIALRLLKPQTFDEKVRPYLKSIDPYVDYDTTGYITKSIYSTIDQIVDLDEQIRKKLYENLRVCSFNRKCMQMQSDTPYTTIVHHDLWVNNIMFSCGSDGNLSKLKFFDFQLTMYHSFVLDLIFFLFTSVDLNILADNFESFLKHYHQHFCRTLESVGCTLEHYTYEKFQAEFQDKAKLELEHIILMFRVILSDKENCPDIHEVNFDFFMSDERINKQFYNRIRLILEQFNKFNLL